LNTEIVNGVSLESSIVSAAGGTPSGRGNLVYDRMGIESLETTDSHDESLVIDERWDQSPAVQVEKKLTRLLRGSMLLVSHLQTRGLLGQR